MLRIRRELEGTPEPVPRGLVQRFRKHEAHGRDEKLRMGLDTEVRNNNVSFANTWPAAPS